MLIELLKMEMGFMASDNKKRRFGWLGKKSKDRSKHITYALFLTPGLILYSIFLVLPVVMGIYYSVTDWNGISRRFNIIGLRNYRNIFRDKRFLNAVGFNLKYTLALTICIVVLGIILALLLNKRVKGITGFRALYFFPAVLSALSVTLIFGQIFYRVLPQIGDKLNIAFLQKSLLSSKTTAPYGVLLVNVWQGVALPTLLFLAGLQTIPEELYESAEIDGASAWARFWHITMPFLVPVLSVVLVLTAKSGLMVFEYVHSLTDGGPGGATESISLLIYRHAFVENKFAYSIAEAMVAGLLIAAISVIQISISNRMKVY